MSASNGRSGEALRPVSTSQRACEAWICRMGIWRIAVSTCYKLRWGWAFWASRALGCLSFLWQRKGHSQVMPRPQNRAKAVLRILMHADQTEPSTCIVTERYLYAPHDHMGIDALCSNWYLLNMYLLNIIINGTIFLHIAWMSIDVSQKIWSIDF